MNRLLLPPSTGDVLKGRLLKSDLETAGILYAHTIETGGGYRLLFRDFVIAPDEAYTTRRVDRIELHPNFLAPLLKRARLNRWSVLLAHTHPWDGPVRPSETDRAGERVLFPAFFRRIPGLPHGRLIIGNLGYDAAIFPVPEEEGCPLTVVQIGPYVMELGADPSLTPRLLSQDARFDRQMRLFGPAGQRILQKLHVGIAGVGGTGSLVAQELAHLGIREFLLIDPDAIEASNLNRVVGAGPSDVGMPKVHVVERFLRGINPDLVITPVVGSVNLSKTAARFLDCDFLFICTDSHGSRAVLNQFSYQFYLPAIDVGVLIDSRNGNLRITGRVQMIGPGLSCLLCSNLLDPDAVRRDLMTEFERQRDPYIVGTPEPQPAVISINGTVSSLAVSMFLSAVTGLPLKSRYQIYRGEIGTVRTIANEPTPGCVVCSESGASGKGYDWDMPGRLQ